MKRYRADRALSPNLAQPVTRSREEPIAAAPVPFGFVDLTPQLTASTYRVSGVSPTIIELFEEDQRRFTKVARKVDRAKRKPPAKKTQRPFGYET